MKLQATSFTPQGVSKGSYKKKAYKSRFVSDKPTNVRIVPLDEYIPQVSNKQADPYENYKKSSPLIKASSYTRADKFFMKKGW